MDDFKNKIAVVTGGGTGMGRELVRQLAREGSHVAMCDVLEDNMLETFEIVSIYKFVAPTLECSFSEFHYVAFMNPMNFFKIVGNGIL